jgi:hypothetical protein
LVDLIKEINLEDGRVASKLKAKTDHLTSVLCLPRRSLFGEGEPPVI